MSLSISLSTSLLPSPSIMLLMALLPTLAAILSSLFFSYKKNINIISIKTSKTTLPPSPPKLPIIGNLHQLGSLPHRSLCTLANRHGPLMLLHLGRRPVLVASSPSIVREITQTHDHLFSGRPSLKAPASILYQGRDIAFAPYGDYWREAKKVAVLHLLSKKKVESYKRVREEEVAFIMAEIEHAPETVNMTEIFHALSRDVICRAMLGEPARGWSWGAEMRQLIHDSSMMLGEFYAGDYIPWLGKIAGFVSGFERRLRKLYKRSDELLERIVQEHRRKIARKKEGDEVNADCFLDTLLSLEDELKYKFPFDTDCIKAIIKDMFGAGTESIYISMEWTMAELVRNPAAMKKLKEEIASVLGSNKTFIVEDDLAEMPYLKAAIKEALRLHPPGPLLVPRQLMEDANINSYRIPKGTMVLINVWAIGRDPLIWDSPEEFRPERFITGEGSGVQFSDREFWLLPFGAGRRVCPGIHFSVVLIELAIANLVYGFEWKPTKGKMEEMDMKEVYGLTTRKRGGLVVNALKAVKQVKENFT